MGLDIFFTKNADDLVINFNFVSSLDKANANGN